MPTDVKVDFYTVEMPEDAPPFGMVISADSKTKDDESRTLSIRGYPVRLQKVHISPGIIEAEMLKIQMVDIPPKATLGGTVGSLGLGTDEGIGGETAFLYHAGTGVLVLQRNRSGVSAKSLAEYFTQKGSLSSDILLHPVIQRDAVKRLARMKEARRVKVRLAGITNPEFFRDDNTGLNQMMDIIEHFNAPSATIEVSMGHQPGSLMVQRVIKLANKVLNLHSGAAGEVSTMEVSGVLEDDSKDVFDVLMYRMVEVVAIRNDRQRRSSYALRRSEIKQAWERRKAELESMFKAEK